MPKPTAPSPKTSSRRGGAPRNTKTTVIPPQKIVSAVRTRPQWRFLFLRAGPTGAVGGGGGGGGTPRAGRRTGAPQRPQKSAPPLGGLPPRGQKGGAGLAPVI